MRKPAARKPRKKTVVRKPTARKTTRKKTAVKPKSAGPGTKVQVLKKAMEAARKSELKKRYKNTILRQTLGVTMTSYLTKLNDDPNVAPGSRVDEYWRSNLINLVAHNYFDQGRIKREASRPFVTEAVVKKFHLRGIQYGNWVNQEDRYNYLFAIALSLDDLKELCGLSYKQVGMNGNLTLAIGARGQGFNSGIAHFEPNSNAINITRYPHELKDIFGRTIMKATKKGNTKYAMMLNFGGIGALAHEWGHAMDFNVDGKKYSSGGRSTRFKPNATTMKAKSAHGAMERLLATLLTNPDGTKSAFRKKLDDVAEKNNKMGEYFLRRTEIFARYFEAWLAMKLAARGRKNTFISKMKYKNVVYPPQNLIRKAEPHMMELLRYFRAKF